MGLFDLPAPLLGAVDAALATFLPALVRILLWGVLAGWLTMLLYRALSNQEKIAVLKAEQKEHQKNIAGFDGEFDELLPLVGRALGTGMRQLGLSLGPALMATVPILFIVVWVAGEFAYRQPEPGTVVAIGIEPADADRTSLKWVPEGTGKTTGTGWDVDWPGEGSSIALQRESKTLLELPSTESIPVIHKRRWWNWLMANPLGYLDEGEPMDTINIALPAQQLSKAGPAWMRGWMFFFFGSFLLSSIAFKLALKID
jgi:hypothetical protein